MKKPKNEITIPAYIKLFYQPALLANESAGDYWDMLKAFATAFRPSDPIEWTYVNNAVAAQFEIRRYRRFKVRAVEEGRTDKVLADGRLVGNELFARGTMLMPMPNWALKNEASTDEANQNLAAEQIEAKEARKQAADAAVDAAYKKMERLAKNYENREGAYGFEKWIGTYVCLDNLQRAVEQRFQDAVDQLGLHRQGRGARLRQIADDIIEAEFNDVSVVPEPAP
jgi:hypothetical protein